MLCGDDGDGRDVSTAIFFVLDHEGSPRLVAHCMRLTVHFHSSAFLACQTAPENAS